MFFLLLNVCCILVFYVFLCCSVCLLLYRPFCHGALKLDIFTLFTTFFLWTSLQFILAGVKLTRIYRLALPFMYLVSGIFLFSTIETNFLCWYKCNCFAEVFGIKVIILMLNIWLFKTWFCVALRSFVKQSQCVQFIYSKHSTYYFL